MGCMSSSLRCLLLEKVMRKTLKPVIVKHMNSLITDFESYFPDLYERPVQLDWIRNPFLFSEHEKNLPSTSQETLIAISVC